MQRLSIGAFSRLTHLSVKTLRCYHETGLLEPAVVDPDSGYRYYRPGQAHSAHLVRRFRDLGLPVADVKAVLAAPDLAARDAILAGHLDRMREQLRQTEAAVDSLHRMLAGPADVAIDERVLDGGHTISVAANVLRQDVSSWWWDAMAGLRAMATAAGLEQAGPAGGLFDDELFTQDAGHARVYLPVKDSPALDGTGPVRERYLTDPLENRATGRWRTEVCWPLARLGRGGEPAQTGSRSSSRVRYLRGMQHYRELETTTPDVSGAWLLQ